MGTSGYFDQPEDDCMDWSVSTWPEGSVRIGCDSKEGGGGCIGM